VNYSKFLNSSHGPFPSPLLSTYLNNPAGILFHLLILFGLHYASLECMSVFLPFPSLFIFPLIFVCFNLAVQRLNIQLPCPSTTSPQPPPHMEPFPPDFSLYPFKDGTCLFFSFPERSPMFFSFLTSVMVVICLLLFLFFFESSCLEVPLWLMPNPSPLCRRVSSSHHPYPSTEPGIPRLPAALLHVCCFSSCYPRSLFTQASTRPSSFRRRIECGAYPLFLSPLSGPSFAA